MARVVAGAVPKIKCVDGCYTIRSSADLGVIVVLKWPIKGTVQGARAAASIGLPYSDVTDGEYFSSLFDKVTVGLCVSDPAPS